MLLIVDMLAGHWAKGVLVKKAGYPPPNIKDYHQLNLIPSFSFCIKEGLWVKEPYNRGVCDTSHGLRYLACGCYDVKAIGENGYTNTKRKTIFEAIEEHYKGKIRIATFASKEWAGQGYWYNSDHCVPLPGYYPDESTIVDYAFPWMKKNQDWDIILLYLPEHDLTATKEGKPVYLDKPKHYLDDKHHHLTQDVDKNVGLVVDFLKHNNFWEDTYLIIASDHAYHLGCDAVNSQLEPNDGPRQSTSFCWDHVPPYDCHVWDFENNKPSGKLSECCRRTTFIISGGALDRKLRGTSIDTAEIIDVPATIAKLLEVPFQ